jgi:fumarate reductase flavoprotein subunit
MQTGEGHVNEELLDDFTKNAANTIDWLSYLGLKWQDVYGHKVIPYEK